MIIHYDNKKVQHYMCIINLFEPNIYSYIHNISNIDVIYTLILY